MPVPHSVIRAFRKQYILRSAALLLVQLAAGLLLSGSAGAARSAATQPPQTPDPALIRTEFPILPQRASPARARDNRHRVPPPVEETVVFNDSLNGLRLDSLAGWTHYDASGGPTAWHIDTFNGCGSNAWWCGVIDSSWVNDPNRAGYDNSWLQYLSNSVPLDSLPAGKNLVLSFRSRFNAEPNYDWGSVDVLDPVESWISLPPLFTGVIPSGAGCDSFTFNIPDSIVDKWVLGFPADSIPGPLPLPFRFTFSSDIVNSSADGLYPGDGWVIDSITFRAGNKVLFFDNVENGMGSWKRSVLPPVGDYWNLDDNLLTEDLCSENRSQVWVDWSPLLQSLVPRLDNELVTPAIPINRSSSVSVAFDVYRNLPLNACFYYHLNFRTKNVGDANWSNWVDPTRLLYYGSQKDWARQKVPLAGAGNHDSLQVQFGLKDYSEIYCDGISSPAGVYAHFDNVQILILQTAPPSFIVRDLDLFEDTFMASPFFKDDNFNSPLGDSAVVQVNATRGYQSGFMHYRFNGASFNSVPLTPVSTALPTHYYVDVPPGSYPANTKMEYYFSVTDSTGATAYAPHDAVASQEFYVASILPLKTAINFSLGCVDSLASILFVNHFAGREAEPYLASSLTAMGFKFDTWNVLGPTSGVGNSLGGSIPGDLAYKWPATDVNSLLGYSTIIWHSGDLTQFTMSREDQAVIQSWLGQPGKDRNFWITGDNVAKDIATTLNMEFNGFLGFSCGMRYVRDIWENVPQDTLHPLVKGVPGSPVAGRLMRVDGDCPLINKFDLVAVSASAPNNGKAGLLFTYPNTFGAATRYATDYNTFNAEDSSRVVFMGYSFNSIEEGGERLQTLRDVLKNYFKENACYIASAVEEEAGTQAPPLRNILSQNNPNPFNPETAINYSLAQQGLVEIRIYNVAGAMVRTLVSRAHGPGTYVARWDGTDDRGRPLPSGAYFYRLESVGFTNSKKLILLR